MSSVEIDVRKHELLGWFIDSDPRWTEGPSRKVDVSKPLSSGNEESLLLYLKAVYKAKYFVDANYVDEEGKSIADPVTIEGKNDETYEAEQKTIKGCRFIKMAKN
ncbi:MAG: MucBP domain-containing protein [Peptoniphilaceae bacterium]|nr:MucBP domain-containing protein [Peptoniphilaceae bacterium]MDY6085353.1 MucBP domain-containing protein [Peptoniphilaceae bacterium]